MKRMLVPLAMTTSILLSACVPSVNPLYTEKDLAFDPALVGAWRSGEDTWAFEKFGDKKYKLLHTDKDGLVGEFEAHLVKLEKQLFLDLYLVDPGQKEEWRINGLAGMAVIIRPGHLFAKVWQIKPMLQLGFMDPDWLEKLLEKIRTPSITKRYASATTITGSC